jgi:hypothetical protein
MELTLSADHVVAVPTTSSERPHAHGRAPAAAREAELLVRAGLVSGRHPHRDGPRHVRHGPEIWTMRSDGGDLRQITRGPRLDLRPDWGTRSE